MVKSEASPKPLRLLSGPLSLQSHCRGPRGIGFHRQDSFLLLRRSLHHAAGDHLVTSPACGRRGPWSTCCSTFSSMTQAGTKSTSTPCIEKAPTLLRTTRSRSPRSASPASSGGVSGRVAGERQAAATLSANMGVRSEATSGRVAFCPDGSRFFVQCVN